MLPCHPSHLLRNVSINSITGDTVGMIRDYVAYPVIS